MTWKLTAKDGCSDIEIDLFNDKECCIEVWSGDYIQNIHLNKLQLLELITELQKIALELK